MMVIQSTKTYSRVSAYISIDNARRRHHVSKTAVSYNIPRQYAYTLLKEFNAMYMTTVVYCLVHSESESTQKYKAGSFFQSSTLIHSNKSLTLGLTKEALSKQFPDLNDPHY